MPTATRIYYQEVLHSVFLYMLSSRLDGAEIQAIVESALARAASNSKNPLEKQGAKDSLVIGAVFYRWFRDPKYLTSDANPRALPLKGRAPSIEALLRGERVTGKRLDALLEQIIDSKLVRALPKSRYAPVGQAAVFCRLSPELIEHVGASFARLLSTVDYNTRTRGKQIRLVERAASVLELPKKDIPAFREFSQSQARSFLANMDDWLESRRVKRGRSGRAVKVQPAGVHVYAFLSP